MKTCSAVGAALALWAGAGCGGGSAAAPNPPPPPPPPPAPPPAASVSVAPATATLFVGDTVRLTATVRDAQGNVLTRAVTWSSENGSVATIGTTGLVTGIGAGGPVTLTATVEGRSGTAAVTVQPPPPIATIEVGRTAATIAQFQDLKLVAVPRSGTGAALANRPMTWSSSDPATISVATDGTVTGQREGSAVVSVAAEGKSTAVTITVVAMTAIAAGFAETCAISTAAKLYCAGTRTGPQGRLVAPQLRFAKVFASARLHDILCGITTAGELYCWGDNYAGELGVGDSVNRSTPTRVGGNVVFAKVVMGQGVRGGLIINGVPGPPAEAANHSCGLTPAGDLYCWGDGKSGQLGTGALVSSVGPVAVAAGTKFLDVTVGRIYSCAIRTDGVTLCWGDNEAGHLGQGAWSSTPLASPTVVPGLPTLHGLSGAGATCGLGPDSRAWCWGDNTLLKLGYTTTETCFGGKACSTTPSKVDGDRPFASLHSSQYSTCALDGNGQVFCWGMNIDDKFGTSLPPGCSTPNSQAPCTATPVAGPAGFASLSTGANTVCGIRMTGGAFCWGGNASGQLGFPGIARTMQPVVFGLDPDTPP